MDVAKTLSGFTDVEKNVGGYDRIARAVLGPVFLVVALAGLLGFVSVGSGTAVTVGLVVVLVAGAIMSVTAYTQECLVNQTLGISTLK